MNKNLNNVISFLSRINKDSYADVIDWLLILAPYTNNALSEEEKNIVVSGISSLRDRIEERTENLRANEIRTILVNAIEHINNNQGIDVAELENHKSKFTNEVKDRIIERLNALEKLMPSDNITETIIELEKERNKIASSLGNPSETYIANPEIEALVAQIGTKEAEINRLEAESNLKPAESNNLNKIIEFKRISDEILEKYEESKNIENDDELAKIISEIDKLIEKRKNLITSISNDKKVLDLVGQIETAENQFLNVKDVQARSEIEKQLKDYMSNLDLSLGVTYDEKKIEEFLEKLADLNEKNTEYVQKKFDSKLSREERKENAKLRDEVSIERDSLIESITDDKTILNLLKEIDDNEELMGENKKYGITDEVREQHYIFNADINNNKSNLKELVEKILREKYVTVSGLQSVNNNSNQIDLDKAKKELIELNNRLGITEQTIKVATTKTDLEKLKILNAKIKSLEKLKDKGVISTRNYISKQIELFENNMINQQDLNARLIELKSNASYLYGINEEGRTQELQEILKQKEKIIAEIERLETKIKTMDSNNKLNDAETSKKNLEEILKNRTFTKIKFTEQELKDHFEHTGKELETDEAKYEIIIKKRIAGLDEQIASLKQNLPSETSYDIYNNPNISQANKSQNTSYKIKEISEQIERLKTNASNGNQPEIQKYQSEIEKLRIWAIDGNQSEISRLNEQINEITNRKNDSINSNQINIHPNANPEYGNNELNTETQRLEIERIKVQIKELELGAKNRNQSKIQELEEKMTKLKEMAKDGNQLEIQRLEKVLDEEKRNNGYKSNTDYLNPEMQNYDSFTAKKRYREYEEKLAKLKRDLNIANGQKESNLKEIENLIFYHKLLSDNLTTLKEKETMLETEINSSNYMELPETLRETKEASLKELKSNISKLSEELQKNGNQESIKQEENKKLDEQIKGYVKADTKQKEDAIRKLKYEFPGLEMQIIRYERLQKELGEKILHETDKKSVWHARLDELNLSKLKAEFEALDNRQKYLSFGKDLDAIIELTGGEKKKDETIAPVQTAISEDETIAPAQTAISEEEANEGPITSIGAQVITKTRDTSDTTKKKFISKFIKNHPILTPIILTALGLGVLVAVWIFAPTTNSYHPGYPKPAVTATLTPETPKTTPAPSQTLSPTPIATQTPVKSNDTSLEYLKINGYAQDLTKPFDATIESNTVKIEAKAKDANARIVGNGEYKVILGNNLIKVTVIAEDGTKKEVDIIIRVIEKRITQTPGQPSPTITPTLPGTPGSGGGEGQIEPPTPTPTPTNTPTIGEHMAENKEEEVIIPGTGEKRPEILSTSLQQGDYIARLTPDGKNYIFTHKSDSNTPVFVYPANAQGGLDNEAWEKLNKEVVSTYVDSGQGKTY